MDWRVQRAAAPAHEPSRRVLDDDATVTENVNSALGAMRSQQHAITSAIEQSARGLEPTLREVGQQQQQALVAHIGGGLIGVGSAVARIDLLTFKVHGKAVGYSLSGAKAAGGVYLLGERRAGGRLLVDPLGVRRARGRLSASEAKAAGLVGSALDAQRAGFSASDAKAAGYSASEARQAGYQDGIQRGAEGCGNDKWRCCDQEVCNTFSRVSERWTCKP